MLLHIEVEPKGYKLCTVDQLLNLAAEAFMDPCDCFQEEPQACEKREGGAGNNQPQTTPPAWAGQPREAGDGL